MFIELRGLKRACRGISLPELILFIVVVGVGLAGVLTVFTSTVSRSSDPLPRKQALAVAESLIEEISLKNYSNPTGGYAGANRQAFDDVGDYVGYTSTGIIAADGVTALPGLASYNVSAVTVAVTTLNGVPAKLITVTVGAPDGQSYSLSAYRTNY
jgi:MSHA pilin protein MshD